MIVQWCMKGMYLPDDAAARDIIDSRLGIVSNWWRNRGKIDPAARRAVLTSANLNLHVNHFGRVRTTTPFISLTAGTVERDAVAKTNTVHSARQTALWFATEFGRRDYGYLYTCWVLVGPRPAAEIEAVAEEVRDLNIYRRYSRYQTQGEVVAKVNVPDNHLQKCEKWVVNPTGPGYLCSWIQNNPRFTRPERLGNVRRLIR